MSASRILNVCHLSGKKITNRLTGISINKLNKSVCDFEQKREASTMATCLNNINPQIKLMEYAVRGPLVIRATEIEKELANGVKKPFKEVIRANIGDCHAMGQIPITFIRQVLALVTYPDLFDDARFPVDAKQRANALLTAVKGGSMGSYTDSAGIDLIRKHVSEYIQNRDGGIKSCPDDIILSTGASGAIKSILALLRCPVDGKQPGIMVPIPQYPLYSATITEYDMAQIGYFLDEDNNWGLSMEELQRSIDEARKTSAPRAIVVINPGNPTGQVLTRENIVEIIKFAHKEQLVIFADEVYQDNVYAKGSKFYSFKKVLIEMGEPYSKMELASFMSCSKGYMGECGIRGGYCEIINLENDVKAMLLKSISAQLCSTTIGQACMDVVVNPPKKGEPSYELFQKEKSEILESLKHRADMVFKAFNSFEGFSCNPVQGAMYCFPQVKLPQKVVDAAKKANQAPDVFYAFQLLENTGICIVPGSGFGQRPNTYHFRTTILPQVELLETMLKKFDDFHREFMNKYK